MQRPEYVQNARTTERRPTHYPSPGEMAARIDPGECDNLAPNYVGQEENGQIRSENSRQMPFGSLYDGQSESSSDGDDDDWVEPGSHPSGAEGRDSAVESRKTRLKSVVICKRHDQRGGLDDRSEDWSQNQSYGSLGRSEVGFKDPVQGDPVGDPDRDPAPETHVVRAEGDPVGRDSSRQAAGPSRGTRRVGRAGGRHATSSGERARASGLDSAKRYEVGDTSSESETSRVNSKTPSSRSSRRDDTDKSSTDMSQGRRSDTSSVRLSPDDRRRRQRRDNSSGRLGKRQDRDGKPKTKSDAGGKRHDRSYSTSGSQRRLAGDARSNKVLTSSRGVKTTSNEIHTRESMTEEGSTSHRGRVRFRATSGRVRRRHKGKKSRSSSSEESKSDRDVEHQRGNSPAGARSEGSRRQDRRRVKAYEPDCDSSEGGHGGSRRRALPTLKLGTYDGTTCLETFLAKLDNCGGYYSWTKKEKLCHLRASLEGRAGNVLWESKSHTSAKELIELLRNRFGSQDQSERYRIELKSRRRKKNEPLQVLFNDICRLMALAYPGVSGALSDVVTRDAILDSLNDPCLKMKILERDPEPKNIEEVLKIACRLEALRRNADDDRFEETRNKDRNVRVAGIHIPGDTAKAEKHVKQLEASLSEYQKKVQDLTALTQQLQQRVTAAEEAARCSQEQAAQAHAENAQFDQYNSYGRDYERGRPTYRRNAWRGRTRPNRDVCNRCGEIGHWARHCSNVPLPAGDATQPSYRRLNSRNGGETYLEARIGGRATYCLLDSGCQYSTLPTRFVAPTDLEPVNIELFAANGSQLPVIGRATMSVEIQGMEIPTPFLVPDDVDEILLGVDFLTSNSVDWVFADAKVRIKGMEVPLLPRPVRGRVRRVYAAERVVVPANCETAIPVTLAKTSGLLPAADWLVEPNEIRAGVVVARTLVSDDSKCCAVRLINVNDSPVEVKGGTCVAEAEILHGCVIDEERDAQRQVDVGRRAPIKDFEHVKPLIDSLPSTLSAAEREQAIELIQRNADVFARNEYDLGRMHLTEHKIDVGENRPFREPLRRHPKAYLDEIDRQVNEMLENDIIEPAASPWASNIVLVVKKPEVDSQGCEKQAIRFCQDFRRLNLLTYRDSYPLPRID